MGPFNGVLVYVLVSIHLFDMFSHIYKKIISTCIILKVYCKNKRGQSSKTKKERKKERPFKNLSQKWIRASNAMQFEYK